jgi:hypothetical protein
MASKMFSDDKNLSSYVRDSAPASDSSPDASAVVERSNEVFQVGVDGVEFRTVSWQRAAVVFLKIQFAMSILSVPEALATIGAVGGGLSIVLWTTLNTCMFKACRKNLVIS